MKTRVKHDKASEHAHEALRATARLKEPPSDSDSRRFGFGRNWKRFLSILNSTRIEQAKQSLQEMLEQESLSGSSFLDIGSGSGLFSLAASLLGARVHSFDYDLDSVECTTTIKGLHAPKDANWTIEQGSVLDLNYLQTLGQFDYVYSWGVLHHTGDMWQALENVIHCVRPNGRLFLSIYNDQGVLSRIWLKIKRLYCSSRFGALVVLLIFLPLFGIARMVLDLMQFKSPFSSFRRHRKERGMSVFFDWIDWLGGYPFEVATPQKIFEFYHSKGFQLTKLRTRGGKSGVNEFVFQAPAEASLSTSS